MLTTHPGQDLARRLPKADGRITRGLDTRSRGLAAHQALSPEAILPYVSVKTCIGFVVVILPAIIVIYSYQNLIFRLKYAGHIILRFFQL